MKFENAKHFLHIDSYARVTAKQYGVRQETIERTVGDACPYSGFVREVIAVAYGVGRTFSDDQWSPLQW